MTDRSPHRSARPLPRSRSHPSRRGWLALALAALSPATTLAANCDGVQHWQPAVIYPAGATLQKDGVLYQTVQTIWNAPPDHPAGRRYYTSRGRCDASGGGGTPAQNLLPLVELTAPANGRTFVTGADIALAATASDRDGSVRQVEFFAGGSSLGIARTAPYALTWRNASAGSYVLRAVATDNQGARATSAVARITVSAAGDGQDRIAPSVPTGLVSPAQTRDSIQLRWNPSSDNNGGSGLAGYHVYRDGTLLMPLVTTFFTDTGLKPDATYQYSVRARDKAGNVSADSPLLRVSTASDAGGDGGNPGGGEPGVGGGRPEPAPGHGADKRLIGYFTQWGIYGRNYKVKQIDSSGSAAKLTHINYAFGNVRNNRCEVGITQAANPGTGSGGDAYADYTRSFGAAESVSGRGDTWNQPLRGNWNQLRQLKAKHPHLKVLISLGGWTWSRGFSSAAQPENRAAFVASCIDAYIKGNLPFTDNAGGAGVAAGIFDGIDVDWEYPAACGLSCGSPADRQNFTALLAEFRRQLDAVRPGLLLTVAVGAGIDKIRVTDPGDYHRYLDFINVMTYDFHGAWGPRTNHHAGLFRAPADPSSGDEKYYNTHDAIEAYLNRGVPASKLSLGVGFYGRGWTNVANVNNGLYQNGRPANGKYEAGVEDWKVLSRLGWPAYRDPAAKAAWIYNGTTFWSFDTPEMLIEKMAYVKAQGLGGAFFWEFSGDDSQGTMVNALDRGLK